MDIAPEKIVVKERLRPGKMLLVDTVQGRVIGDEELKEMYADRQPYGEWLDSNLIELKNLKIPNQLVPTYKPEELKRLQKAFGYSYEEVETSIKNMALNGGEGTAGWHLPRARHHDGRGDAVQVDPHSVQQTQVVSQDLHPICGDGAEPHRAVYRKAEGARPPHLRH